MIRLIRDFTSDRKGLSLIEYALLAALVSTTMVVLLLAMGGSLKSSLNAILVQLATA
jgi:Flp pilus assembly pilin Flp